jgi:HupE / UreJ protein
MPAAPGGWRYAAASVGAAALVVLSTTVHAHEIGTTRVSAVFHDGRTYDIEIVTDASSLVEKLQSSTGAAPNVPTTAPALESGLAGFTDTFAARCRVSFDGSPVRPSTFFSVPPGADGIFSPVATIRLTGTMPPGARLFTWTYGWTFSSYALTIRTGPSQDPVTEWLEGGQPSTPFALASSAPPVNRLATASRYLTLGFTHIVPWGFDHVLFVLGIYLLSGRARAVLAQVTAFTVAHSITLGLSMYGLVAMSPRIVEPLIGVSIAYVAVENIVLGELRKWRVALVFAFGLLHGLGFAGALKELGLPRGEFATALFTFNVGVEAGQLAVIAAAFALIGCYCAKRTWYRSRIVIPASAAIAGVAVYWTVERLFV